MEHHTKNYRIRYLISFALLMGLVFLLRPYIWPTYFDDDYYLHDTRADVRNLRKAIRAYYSKVELKEEIQSISDLFEDLVRERFIEDGRVVIDSWGHELKGVIQHDDKSIRVWIWSCGANGVDDRFQKDDIGEYIQIEKSSIPESVR